MVPEYKFNYQCIFLSINNDFMYFDKVSIQYTLKLSINSIELKAFSLLYVWNNTKDSMRVQKV